MGLRCCCYFECSCFFICCGLLCPFTKKRGGRGRPVGVVFRGHHVFRPPRQSRAVKGEDDWNKIEHDINTPQPSGTAQRNFGAPLWSTEGKDSLRRAAPGGVRVLLA